MPLGPAWMLLRGMGWRNSCEMAAAMVLPVISFVWLNITESAQCGAYCGLDGGGHARVHALSPHQVLDADVAGGPWKRSVPVLKLAGEGLPRVRGTGEHPAAAQSTGSSRLPWGFGASMDWKACSEGVPMTSASAGDVVAQTRSELADIADSIRSHRFLELLRTRDVPKARLAALAGGAAHDRV